MNKYIDLSHDIVNNMPVYPGDSDVNLYQNKCLDKDGYTVFNLEIGMHTGTHIDTPMHLLDRNTFINEIPLDRFAGRGCLLDARNEKLIEYKPEYADIVNENDIVILFTNYSEFYGSKEYYTNHPVISEELADFLIEKNIKMLGIDMPSPDRYPFEIHKKLFENNILIMENLTNLEELLDVDDFEIIAFPLKIEAEASIVRAVARRIIIAINKRQYKDPECNH
ncbi:MAG: cyclase family protein [Clostridiales bacterium]|nr:cyclase family protein [Clostridiales bacterium]